jgi:hypothetical protein
MKQQAQTNVVIRSSLALILALALWAPIELQAAEPPARKMMEGKMTERCQAMSERREKMMAEMKAQDAELAAQLVAMNNAPDNKKLVLLAAVVTRLVEQRTAMHARMEKMQGDMTQHMAGHMQMGAESMAGCPMMSGMGDKSGNASHEPK